MGEAGAEAMRTQTTGHSIHTVASETNNKQSLGFEVKENNCH